MIEKNSIVKQISGKSRFRAGDGRKTLIAVCLVVLAGAIIIAGTIAFMTDRTENKINNMSYASAAGAIEAMLVEPAWDGIIAYEYEDGVMTPVYAYLSDESDPPHFFPVYGYQGGATESPILEKALAANTPWEKLRPRDEEKLNPKTGEPYGDEAAANLGKGEKAEKNPMIVNVGGDEIWAAAKVTFIYDVGEKAGKPLSAVDTALFLKVFEMEFDRTKWEVIFEGEDSASMVFYYKELLTGVQDGDNPENYSRTVPLFDRIRVREETGIADLLALEAFGSVDIFVEGFAAEKAVAGVYSNGENGFKEWGKSGGVVFKNSPSAESAADISHKGGIVAKSETK